MEPKIVLYKGVYKFEDEKPPFEIGNIKFGEVSIKVFQENHLKAGGGGDWSLLQVFLIDFILDLPVEILLHITIHEFGIIVSKMREYFQREDSRSEKQIGRIYTDSAIFEYKLQDAENDDSMFPKMQKKLKAAISQPKKKFHFRYLDGEWININFD